MYSNIFYTRNLPDGGFLSDYNKLYNNSSIIWEAFTSLRAQLLCAVHPPQDLCSVSGCVHDCQCNLSDTVWWLCTAHTWCWALQPTQLQVTEYTVRWGQQRKSRCHCTVSWIVWCLFNVMLLSLLPESLWTCYTHQPTICWIFHDLVLKDMV